MSISTLWGREPSLIIAAIQAVVALAVAFGLDLSPEQVGGILAVSAAILGILTRSQVTPSASTDAAGQ